MSVVEFALISPILFLLLLGIIVACIVITNQIQLSNAVRDGARAAAVCGGVGSTTSLPNRQPCDNTHLLSFIAGSLNAVPGVVGLNVTVINGNSNPNDPNILDECQKGKTIVVDATFAQPLYIPLVGVFVGDTGNSSIRTLRASAEATCEQ